MVIEFAFVLFKTETKIIGSEVGNFLAGCFLKNVLELSLPLDVSHLFQYLLVILKLFRAHLLPSVSPILSLLQVLQILILGGLHPLLAKPLPLLDLLLLRVQVLLILLNELLDLVSLQCVPLGLLFPAIPQLVLVLLM